MSTEILHKLSSLDLSKYPYEEIKSCIRRYGNFGCIRVTHHPGKIIMRARPNHNGERFLSKSELSYKPQQFNKTYQRASTPNETMFYGCVIPEDIQPNELDNTRIIGAMEALPWLRDNRTKGIQKISFGKWIVTKDINLIAIVHHKDFYHASSYTRELVQAFTKFIKQYPDLEEKTILITDFLASEFAKNEIKADYDYVISAVFNEMVVRHDKNIDGVLYPSVRVEGRGFNVAIKPEAANDKLELQVASECTIYKYYNKSIVDNETVAMVDKHPDTFSYLPVDAQYHTGEAECLKHLGLASIDDLK